MKRFIVAALVVMCSASLACAQGGVLQVTADPAGTDCNLLDVAPGLALYWVVHVFTPGATASQFSAPQPGCAATLTWLSDQPQFPVTIGSSQTGVAVGYGGCLTTPIAVLLIQYFGSGLTAPCCAYPVLPDPNVASGTIEVVDCANNLISANGGTSVINPDATCGCDVIATEETTWGNIKSLYAD